MDLADRQLVAALQLNARATYRQLALALDMSESTIARRVGALCADGRLRITAVTDPIACGLGRPVLVRLRCRAGTAGEVARELAPRPDVRFLAGVTGTYDLIMELIVGSKRHLAEVLSYQLVDIKGATWTTTDAVLRTLKTSYDWSRELLPDDVARALEETAHRGAVGTGRAQEQGRVSLDSDDLALVVVLREDGRATYKELADQTGLSEATARRRVEALVGSGAIFFATIIEPAELGFDAEFFFHARVRPDRLEAVAEAFAARPEVRYLSSSFGYGGLTGEVILHSQDEVYEFSRETFAQLDGIVEVEIALELETYKRAHALTETQVKPRTETR
jgi:DNA-binding Lrp family transcriptional regulator